MVNVSGRVINSVNIVFLRAFHSWDYVLNTVRSCKLKGLYK